ncbi:hypothetical protein K449DRAFT_341459 [Hypoxylon sp. EC38]|nr:hypothetical protein K449DRAFT_341459 [Hypoxylon sp. EC38]OTA72608.1 hypothetical protein M434DRAFT_88593 [Hypoxylon sp. CO27-5]
MFLTLRVKTFLLFVNVVWLLRLIFTDRNSANSLLALVILVFVSERSRFNSAFRNSLILFIRDTQSSLEPLTPIIQSSAYLTYSNFLKLGSISSLDGIWMMILWRRIFSFTLLALSFSFDRRL